MMKDFRLLADRVGVFASTACAVHCLALPLLLVAGVTFPVAFLEDEFIHQALLFFVLPAAIVAFSLGCKKHKDLWVLGAGGLGLVGICSAAVLHEALGENLERIVTLISAALLIAAHIRNYKLCRTEHCEHD